MDIMLLCKGNTKNVIKITNISLEAVKGSDEATTQANKYCNDNLKDHDGGKTCLISLKRIYEAEYPTTGVTEVSYQCSNGS